MKRLWVLCCGLIALALPLWAEPRPLAGQDDPAFQAALERWLQGDEAAALPALAALAAADNAAAQVLIGLIDVTPQYHGEWLMARPRSERIALMRVPRDRAGAASGLSGRNWIYEAARTEPLAKAWLDLWDGGATPQVMLDFAALGEDSAARLAAKRLARREVKGFGALADDPDFPQFALGLALREWQASDPARARAMAEKIGPADPVLGLVGPYNPDPVALLDMAETHPALRILLHHLVVQCPEDPYGDPDARAKRLAAAQKLMGGWWGLADLGPPVETLIDPDQWALSRKGGESFVRLFPTLTRQDLQDLHETDRCLAFLSALAAEERGALP